MAGWSGEGEKKEVLVRIMIPRQDVLPAHIYSYSQSIFTSSSSIIFARESPFLCVSHHLLAAEKRCSATRVVTTVTSDRENKSNSFVASSRSLTEPFCSARQSYLLSAFVFTGNTIISPERLRVASSPPGGGYSAVERWEQLFSTQLSCPQPARTCVADVADLEITPASN
jgi:hypothetical protein